MGPCNFQSLAGFKRLSASNVRLTETSILSDVCSKGGFEDNHEFLAFEFRGDLCRQTTKQLHLVRSNGSRKHSIPAASRCDHFVSGRMSKVLARYPFKKVTKFYTLFVAQLHNLACIFRRDCPLAV